MKVYFLDAEKTKENIPRVFSGDCLGGIVALDQIERYDGMFVSFGEFNPMKIVISGYIIIIEDNCCRSVDLDAKEIEKIKAKITDKKQVEFVKNKIKILEKRKETFKNDYFCLPTVEELFLYKHRLRLAKQLIKIGKENK